jgi:hypothetical protein
MLETAATPQRGPTERERIVRWLQTKGDVPQNGVVIDATAPVVRSA